MGQVNNKEALDSFFGFVFAPVDEDSLEKMLNAANLIFSISFQDYPNLHDLKAAIDRIDEADNRDIFRRKAALILADVKLWDAARSIAYQSELMIERIDTLILLAKKLLEASNFEGTFALLDQAQRIITEEDRGDIWMWQKISSLNEIAIIFHQLNHIEKAVETWKKALYIAKSGSLDHDERIALKNTIPMLESLGYSELSEEAQELSGYKNILKRPRN